MTATEPSLLTERFGDLREVSAECLAQPTVRRTPSRPEQRLQRRRELCDALAPAPASTGRE